MNLPDDPNLDIDLTFAALNLDLFTPGRSTDPSQRSSRLTPLSRPSIQSSHQQSILSLEFGTSDTGGGRDVGGFAFPDNIASSTQRSNQLDDLPEAGEDGFFKDPGFAIDDDGNMIEDSPSRGRQRPLPGMDESEIDRRVREEHEEGARAGMDLVCSSYVVLVFLLTIAGCWFLGHGRLPTTSRRRP